MLKIDNNLLQELGLAGLPDTEKNSFLKHIYETLEMRVGVRLADQMTNEQLDEFERYFEAKDDAGAFKWLETNFPNYKEIVQQEFDKLKAEVAQNAPQILAASQANAQQAPAPAAQQPQAAPQQYQQPQPQYQQPQQDQFAPQQQPAQQPYQPPQPQAAPQQYQQPQPQYQQPQQDQFATPQQQPAQQPYQPPQPQAAPQQYQQPPEQQFPGQQPPAGPSPQQ